MDIKGTRMGVPLGTTELTDEGLPSKTTIAQLRLNVPPAQWLYVQGYAAPGDNGGGMFNYVPGDTTTSDNGGTVIVDASGHRYFRVIPEGAVNACWFGATGGGTVDDTASIQAAIHTWNRVVPPGGAQQTNS